MSDKQTLSRLAPLLRWVLWRNEKRNGRATKIPKQINGKEASSTDAKTWATRSSWDWLKSPSPAVRRERWCPNLRRWRSAAWGC